MERHWKAPSYPLLLILQDASVGLNLHLQGELDLNQLLVLLLAWAMRIQNHIHCLNHLSILSFIYSLATLFSDNSYPPSLISFKSRRISPSLELIWRSNVSIMCSSQKSVFHSTCAWNDWPCSSSLLSRSFSICSRDNFSFSSLTIYRS